MAGNISDFAELKLLDHITGRVAYTKPTATYLGLYNVAPTDGTTGTECATSGSYARVAVTWGAAASGSIANSGNIVFPTATGSWGTVVAVGLFDQLTTGNLLWYGPLSASVSIATSDTFTITTGGLTLSLD